jgi:hypothetical protein
VEVALHLSASIKPYLPFIMKSLPDLPLLCDPYPDRRCLLLLLFPSDDRARKKRPMATMGRLLSCVKFSSF